MKRYKPILAVAIGGSGLALAAAGISLVAGAGVVTVFKIVVGSESLFIGAAALITAGFLAFSRP